MLDDRLCFGIVDLTSGKLNELELNVDGKKECRISVGLDGFAITQGKQLFCFNSKRRKWRYV